MPAIVAAVCPGTDTCFKWALRARCGPGGGHETADVSPLPLFITFVLLLLPFRWTRKGEEIGGSRSVV